MSRYISLIIYCGLAALAASGQTTWQPATGGIYYGPGNVGIGTSTPSAPLTVVPNGYTAVTASGGTLTFNGGYEIHTFTSSGTFQLTAPGTITAQVLVVGGGGGGGGSSGYATGGGGGGGAVLYNSSFSLAPGSYQVTVGAGGLGGSSLSSGAQPGQSSVFSTLTAIGGGYGGGGFGSSVAGTGASGGGAGGYPMVSGASGTGGQGNAGGASYTDGNYYYAGGGGGAGWFAVSDGSGYPGRAIANSISGTATSYASGGYAGTPWGCGPYPYYGASPNSGSGGPGAGGACASTGGAGSAGVVVVSFIRNLPPAAIFSGTVGIGTTSPCANGQAPLGCALSVNGGIQAKEVVVNPGWSDYVFDPEYKLSPLADVAAYIAANHHLPDIPSADEVAERGVSVGEIESKLLAKIEELTLHLIDEKQRADRLEERLDKLETSGAKR